MGGASSRGEVGPPGLDRGGLPGPLRRRGRSVTPGAQRAGRAGRRPRRLPPRPELERGGPPGRRRAAGSRRRPLRRPGRQGSPPRRSRQPGGGDRTPTGPSPGDEAAPREPIPRTRAPRTRAARARALGTAGRRRRRGGRRSVGPPSLGGGRRRGRRRAVQRSRSPAAEPGAPLAGGPGGRPSPPAAAAGPARRSGAARPPVWPGRLLRLYAHDRGDDGAGPLAQGEVSGDAGRVPPPRGVAARRTGGLRLPHDGPSDGMYALVLEAGLEGGARRSSPTRS